MQDGIGGDDAVRRLENIRAAIKRSDHAPGFGNDQGTGGQIPGFEPDFPITIETAGGDIAQVKGGGTEAAHALGAEEQAAKEFDVVKGGMADVVRLTSRSFLR